MKNIKTIIIALVSLVTFVGFTSCKKANAGPTPLKIWQRSDTAYEYKNGVELTVVFNEMKQEFRVGIKNNNTNTITNARVEIHTFDANTNAIFEYGPTPDTDVLANDTLNIIIPAGTTLGNFAKFSMHVEYGNPAGSGG